MIIRLTENNKIILDLEGAMVTKKDGNVTVSLGTPYLLNSDDHLSIKVIITNGTFSGFARGQAEILNKTVLPQGEEENYEYGKTTDGN